MTVHGLISFVGAGPGAADLMTLRAADRLTRADLVVYAGSLVPEAVLVHTQKTCRTVSSASLVLDEIVALMYETAFKGGRVVRLHSGDPCLYSALNEQWQKLQSDRFDCEIVPGVPAFAAVAAAAGVELTLAGGPQSVILTRPGKEASAMPAGERLESLAQHKTSLCLHLAGKRLFENISTLIEVYGGDCPAILASCVSWPNERLYRGTLSDLRDSITEDTPRQAVLLMVTPKGNEGHQSALYSAAYYHSSRPAPNG